MEEKHMNIRRISAALTAAALAVSAMAVSAFAAHVKYDENFTGLQGAISDFAFADITNNEMPEDAPEGADFVEAMLPEDVITVTLTTDADTSDWFVGLLGADENLEGLMGVYSEMGETTVTTTLQKIMDMNGFSYDEIYAIALVIEGPADDEVYDVSIKVTGESPETDGNEGAASNVGDTTGAGADPEKGSPETGAAGVAVVAGIAVVAAGAIVVAKKRK